MRASILIAVLAASAMSAMAAEPQKKPANGAAKEPPPVSVPKPPPLPPNYHPSEVAPPDAFEPEITITTKGTEIHQEYRANGRLYMIKVTPAKGPPYYLIDYEGSGVMRRSEFDPGVSVPLWVIKSF